jgi:hypothetical protein
MSEQFSTHLMLREPSDELIANEPWTIDTYADGLMNELFADINTILDSRGNLPSQFVEPDSFYIRTITAPQIVLQQRQTAIEQSVQLPPPLKTNSLKKVVINTSSVRKPISKPAQKSRRYGWGELFRVGASIGFAFSSVVWLLNSGLFNLLVSTSFQQKLIQPQPVIQSQLPTKAEIEADFVNYVLGALAIIDSQQAKNNLKPISSTLNASASTNQTALAYVRPSGNLPQPVAANNQPPAPNNSTTIVERIYVPVYQAPMPMRYTPPSIANALKPLPPAPTPSKDTSVKWATKGASVTMASNTEQKPTQPVTKAKKATVPPDIKPVTVKSSPVTLQQTAPLPPTPTTVEPPAPPVASAPTPAQTEEVAVSPPVASPSHVLEGLLELGSKSAALFRIDGVTRRVEVGESIGSSGWALVEVANGEAIIRRNGEVRSVYAGQKF